jgi:hypothetical protein
LIDARFKNFFFDRPAVMKRTTDGARKVLSGFGSYVRQIARNSLKYGSKPAPPGKPPTVYRHALFRRKNKKKAGNAQPSSPLKELIFFGWDDNRRSIVIGPMAFPSTNGKATDVLEHGGDEEITLPDGRKVHAHYEARPFMGPAAEKAMPKLPSMWANSIK